MVLDERLRQSGKGSTPLRPEQGLGRKRNEVQRLWPCGREKKGKVMIARIWHGIVPEAKAEAYTEYLKRTGIPGYRAAPGNRGVQLLRCLEDGKAHFLLLTHWESMDAIRRFAGDDPEKARYYPEDAQFLIELEPRVKHYEPVDV